MVSVDVGVARVGVVVVVVVLVVMSGEIGEYPLMVNGFAGGGINGRMFLAISGCIRTISCHMASLTSAIVFSVSSNEKSMGSETSLSSAGVSCEEVERRTE